MNISPGIIRYIALDDNLLDLMAIKLFAANYPSLQNCGHFQDAASALDALNTIKPEVAFIDVDMPGINGIEFVKAVKEKIPVSVFITSHPEYALEGFALDAMDYIVKPLTPERFALTVQRIQDYLDLRARAANYTVLFEPELVTFKHGYNKMRIPQREIVFLEAMHDFTKIKTFQKTYTASAPLSTFMESLPKDKFLRVHRSYAVAVGKITEARYAELVCGNVTIPIGKTYRTAVAQLNL